MDRRGFVGSAVAGIAGLFGLAKTASAETVEAKEPNPSHPLLDAIQWQIPTKRRETWLWAEYFYANDAEVARLLDMQQALYLEAMGRESSDYDKALVGNLCLFGNSFWTEERFLNFKDEDQEKGLSPYYVEFDRDGSASVLPDNDLKKIIWFKQPRSVYDRIPQHFRAMILANRPMPICVHRFAIRSMMGVQPRYCGEGRPRWYSFFRYLVCKQKMMEQTFVRSPDAEVYRKEIEKFGNPIAAETELTEKAYRLLQGKGSYRQLGMEQRGMLDSAILRDIEEVDREACRFKSLFG
jgi:hypothetical protein